MPIVCERIQRPISNFQFRSEGGHAESFISAPWAPKPWRTMARPRRSPTQRRIRRCLRARSAGQEAYGLAQLRFEQIWPDVSRIERPTESTLRGLASPKLLELRELIGQLALAQGRKVVVFSQWRRMLKLAHWATRNQPHRPRPRRHAK